MPSLPQGHLLITLDQNKEFRNSLQRTPLLGAPKMFRHSLQERLRSGGRGYASMQDLVEAVLSAVEFRGIVRVLADGCSGKIDTGKEPLGARPRKQFGCQGDVSRGLGIAPDGASRGR